MGQEKSVHTYWQKQSIVHQKTVHLHMLHTLSFLEDQIQKKVFSTTDACFYVKFLQGIQKYELILNPTSPF